MVNKIQKSSMGNKIINQDTAAVIKVAIFYVHNSLGLKEDTRVRRKWFLLGLIVQLTTGESPSRLCISEVM